MRRTLLVILLLASWILLACGIPQQPAATPTPVNNDAGSSTIVAQPGPPEELRWSLEGITDLVSLDPAEPVNAASNTAIGLVYGGLIRFDHNLEVQPDAAERWEVSTDGRTYTFFLRPDLRFGDGSPVIAADFVYSINRALAPETASYGAPFQLAQIVGAEDVTAGRQQAAGGIVALDDHTLQITLKEPQAYFLAQLNYSYTYVVPQALVTQGGDWKRMAYGTGPYRVAEWRRGEWLELEANPFYWAGQPGFARIRLLFYPDSAVAVQDYLDGKLDIVGGQQTPLPAAQLPQLQNRPDFRTTASLVTRYVGFNHTQAPFESLEMRRALALAIDKSALIERALPEAAQPAARILPQGLMGTELPIKALAFDPTQAQAALASAAPLQPLTLTYGIEGDNALVAQALQAQWQTTLGLDVRLQALPLEDFVQALDTTYRTPERGLQMYLSVWGADYPDPQNFLSQQLRGASPNNNGHYSSAEFDHLVDRADRLGKAEEIDQRLQLYNEAEQIAIDEVGWLPLFYPTYTMLLRTDIAGMEPTPIGLVVEDWTAVRRH